MQAKALLTTSASRCRSIVRRLDAIVSFHRPILTSFSLFVVSAALSTMGSLIANSLRIYRGDGTLLALTTDYTVTGNSIKILQVPGFSTLRGVVDDTGVNVLAIFFDLLVGATYNGAPISQPAKLDSYAAIAGGESYALSLHADARLTPDCLLATVSLTSPSTSIASAVCFRLFVFVIERSFESQCLLFGRSSQATTHARREDLCCRLARVGAPLTRRRACSGLADAALGEQFCLRATVTLPFGTFADGLLKISDSVRRRIDVVRSFS